MIVKQRKERENPELDFLHKVDDEKNAGWYLDFVKQMEMIGRWKYGRENRRENFAKYQCQK